MHTYILEKKELEEGGGRSMIVDNCLLIYTFI
jgi:hypothetical protein